MVECRVARGLLRSGYACGDGFARVADHPCSTPRVLDTGLPTQRLPGQGLTDGGVAVPVPTMCTPEVAGPACRCRHHSGSARSLPADGLAQGCSDTRSRRAATASPPVSLRGLAALPIDSISHKLPAGPYPGAVPAQGLASAAKAVIELRAAPCWV